MPPSLTQSPAFPATRWSWIVTSRQGGTPEGRAALAELCRAYWYPIYALIRRKGHSANDAADLTQDYFARLIEGGLLTAADPDKGRFRAFLQVDCRYFMADERDRQRARKRGGGGRHRRPESRRKGRPRHRRAEEQ